VKKFYKLNQTFDQVRDFNTQKSKEIKYLRILREISPINLSKENMWRKRGSNENNNREGI